MTQITSYGGNNVQALPADLAGELRLAQSPVVFRVVKLAAGQRGETTDLGSYTIFAIPQTDGAILRLSDGAALGAGDSVTAERTALGMTAENGEVLALIGGTVEPQADAASVTLTRRDDHYTVRKPWGHELWVNGASHGGYAFKEVFVRAGHRTSLQYHNFKVETYLVVSGAADLVYQRDPSVAIDDVRSEHLGRVGLNPGTFVDLQPRVLHRLEPTTDFLLYEVTTPHLDDVVRLQDDTARPSGRIQDEHRQ